MGAWSEDVAEGEVVGGGDWAVADPDGAEGEAAGDALGPTDGVRGEVWGDGFPAAPMAGTAEAGLDLVEEEEGVVAAAELFAGLEEFRGGDVDAAFALDWFEEDGDGVFVEGGFEGGDVVEGEVGEAFEERAEAGFDLFLAGGGDAAEGSAVEAVVEGDDAAARGAVGFRGEVAEFASEFEEGLVGFGAGVAEEALAWRFHDGFDEEAAEFALAADLVPVGAVDEALALFGEGGGDGRGAMAEGADGDAAAEVEELAAAFVVEP